MKRTIGALIFEGFEMLDYYGPLELFAMHPDEYEIVAVAETAEPVRASGGPRTVPDAGFDRDFDMLLIPGGMGTRELIEHRPTLDWLRRASNKAQRVMSVCTGSILLAASGVLDGRRATTNKLWYGRMTPRWPGVNWQRTARWVVDGRFVTASGVSAGIDMARAVIAEDLGEQAARDATMWAEYVANTNPDHDPFAVEEPE